MRRATADRINHGIAAGAVLLAHGLLIWFAIQFRFHYTEQETLLAAAQPVIATLLERPRNLSLGPVPIEVKTQNVIHLQRLAPKTPDIAVEEPELAMTEPLPQAASAPIARLADAGLDGDASASSGPPGSGHAPVLLERVIPRYPSRSARLREEGATAVHVRVDESGRVAEVKLTRSSGSKRLDSAAIDAVRKWKFARSPVGSAPSGTWVATELRFLLYRFMYSRLGDDATDSVYVEETRIGATDEATPGSHEALTRFIAEVKTGNFPDDAKRHGGSEVARMRAALEEWGEVQSIRFTGTAGGPRWIAYEVDSKNSDVLRPTVEVSWNTFEVQHQNATSEWLVAVDREGTIWNARASRAPWQ